MSYSIKSEKSDDTLKELKNFVKDAHEYMDSNYKRAAAFTKFVAKTSIDANERGLNDDLGKPTLEFNVGDAYISRLLGEFIKQEPSIEVSEDPHSLERVPSQLIKIVEGHMRHVFNEARKDNHMFEGYKNVLQGGFTFLEIWTEYAASMGPAAFSQVIKFGKVRNSVLCGFDPMAITPTKHDGQYAYKIMPMDEDEFKRKFPKIDISKISFTKNIDAYNWSFSNLLGRKVLMVCEFYKKKYKKYKIVQLADGQVMPIDDYKEMIRTWPESGRIEQPPVIMGKPRETEKEIICRYIFIENQILSYQETYLPGFPIVYCPGNDEYIQENASDTPELMTRPYLYHYKDAQKLKNFTGQSLAFDLQNIIQHKFMIQKEAIPTEGKYNAAYKNVQRASLLVYNGFDPNDPSKPLAPPSVVNRQPIPPELSSVFGACDQLIQNILGSYDAQLGINNNQLSGEAIFNGAIQTNSVALPYLNGYMQGINRIAELYVKLMPIVMTTDRSIPILDSDGNKNAVDINPNSPGGTKFNFSPDALHIKVEAGVNFAIQQNRTLQQIIKLMQVSPSFSQFMDQKGMGILLDNLSGVRGIEYLKEQSVEWMQQQQQAAEQQKQQMQNMPNPEVMKVQIEQKKLELDQKDLELRDLERRSDDAVKAAEIAVSQQKAENERLKLMLEYGESQANHSLKREQLDTERERAAVDLAIKNAQHEHRATKEMKELEHRMSRQTRTE